jgi:hypothetical protein
MKWHRGRFSPIPQTTPHSSSSSAAAIISGRKNWAHSTPTEEIKLIIKRNAFIPEVFGSNIDINSLSPSRKLPGSFLE